MSKQKQSEFDLFITQMFGFLQTEKGFTRPLLITKRRNYMIYDYRSMEIGIEVDIDFFEQVYFLHLVKLQNGDVPRTILWAHNQVVRRPLELILERQMNIHDDTIDEVKRLHKIEQVKQDVNYGKTIMTQYHSLLVKYIDYILQQPLDVLFPMEQPKGVKGVDYI